MEDGAEGARVRVDVCDRGFGGITVGAIADGGVGGVTELVHGHAIRAVAEGRHEAITPEVALQDAKAAVGVLPHAAVVGAGGIVGERERVSAATKIERRGQAAPVARAIGGGVALGEIVAHRDAIVGGTGEGAERAAHEREPGKFIDIGLRGGGRGRGKAVTAEPRWLRVKRVGGGDTRLAVFAKMDVTAPIALDVKPAREGIHRAVKAEGGVGLAAESGVVADERAGGERRALGVVGQVEAEFTRGLPVGGERVIVQTLLAERTGAAGIATLWIEQRIGHDERGGGAAGRAVGRTDDGIVIGAGEVGADGVEDGAVVFDEGRAAVQAAGRAVARGDAERNHRGSGRDSSGSERHRADATRVAVVIPSEHFVDGREGLDDGTLITAGLAHCLEGDGARRAGGDGGEDAILVLEIELPPAAVFLVQRSERECEPVLHEHAVDVEFGATALPRAEAVAEVGAVAVRDRRLGRLIEHATRRAHAEEEGVGTARVVEPSHAVGIHICDTGEIIHPLARREAADHRAVEEIFPRDGRVLAGLAGLPRTGVQLGVHREIEQSREIGDREIVEEFLREHGHGARGVAQAGVEARTGQGVFRGVAGVARGIDRERTQFDDGLLRRGRRQRARCDLGHAT